MPEPPRGRVLPFGLRFSDSAFDHNRGLADRVFCGFMTARQHPDDGRHLPSTEFTDPDDDDEPDHLQVRGSLTAPTRPHPL